jgi:hypothetical protein
VLHPAINTGDDIKHDMEQILSFFRTIKGRHPKVIPDFKQE